MTPEERANDILRRCWWDERPEFAGLDVEIASAIRAAVLEEREACAKIADDRSECGDPDVFHAAQSIADLIRGRAP